MPAVGSANPSSTSTSASGPDAVQAGLGIQGRRVLLFRWIDHHDRGLLGTAYERTIGLSPWGPVGVDGEARVYPGPMRAVTIVEGSLEWLEHPDPDPGPGEVLVRVAAAGINAADLLQRRGLYPPPPGSPEDIPGMNSPGRWWASDRGRPGSPSGTGSCPSPAAGPRRNWPWCPRPWPCRCPRGSPGTRPAGSPRRSAPPTMPLFTQAESACRRAGAHLRCGRWGGHRRRAAGHASGPTWWPRCAHRRVTPTCSASVPMRSSIPTPAPITVPTTCHSNWWVRPGWPPTLPALAIEGRIVVIGVGAGATVELNLLALMGAGGPSGVDAAGPEPPRRRRP